MDELFLGETLLFFLICILTVIGMLTLLRKLISSIINYRTESRTSAIIQTMGHPDIESNTGLMTAWYNATNSGKNIRRRVAGKILTDYLMEQLNLYYKVETYSSTCNMDQRSCHSILKLEKDNKLTFLAMSWDIYDVVDGLNRPYYVFPAGVSPSTYSFKEEGNKSDIIVISTGVQYVSGEADPLLESILKNCMLQQTSYKDVSKAVRVFRLSKSGGAYYLKSLFTKGSVMSENELNNSYSPVELEHEGSFYTIAMGKALPVITNIIEKGGNIILFGLPGVGKTSLMAQIQAQLTNGSNTRLILMTPAQIKELNSSSEAQSAFINALHNDGLDEGNKTVNVIFIDEGESLLVKGEHGIHSMDNTIVLQMMSGQLQQQLNLRMVIAFNAQPSQLNAALFRRGRASVLVNMKPLSKEQAINKIELLKQSMPECTFDEQLFEKLLADENKLINGVEYAKAGEITLADVYSCMIPISTHDHLRKAIEQTMNTEQTVNIEQADVIKAPKTKLTASEYARLK